MIFDSIEKGLSKKEIVDILNNKKIKTPMEYIKNSDEGRCGISVWLLEF